MQIPNKFEEFILTVQTTTPKPSFNRIFELPQMRRVFYYEEKLTPQRPPILFSSISFICSFFFQTFPLTSKLANKVLASNISDNWWWLRNCFMSGGFFYKPRDRWDIKASLKDRYPRKECCSIALGFNLGTHVVGVKYTNLFLLLLRQMRRKDTSTSLPWIRYSLTRSSSFWSCGRSAATSGLTVIFWNFGTIFVAKVRTDWCSSTTCSFAICSRTVLFNGDWCLTISLVTLCNGMWNEVWDFSICDVSKGEIRLYMCASIWSTDCSLWVIATSMFALSVCRSAKSAPWAMANCWICAYLLMMMMRRRNIMCQSLKRFGGANACWTTSSSVQFFSLCPLEEPSLVCLIFSGVTTDMMLHYVRYYKHSLKKNICY